MKMQERLLAITNEVLSEESLDKMKNNSLKSVILGGAAFVALSGLSAIAPAALSAINAEAVSEEESEE